MRSTGKAAPNADLSHKKRRYIHQNIGSGCSHRLRKIAICFLIQDQSKETALRKV